MLTYHHKIKMYQKKDLKSRDFLPFFLENGAIQLLWSLGNAADEMSKTNLVNTFEEKCLCTYSSQDPINHQQHAVSLEHLLPHQQISNVMAQEPNLVST